MPQLGDKRIRSMFAEFGLATDKERSRFMDLAHIGAIEIPGADDCPITFVESPSTAPADEHDAELP